MLIMNRLNPLKFVVFLFFIAAVISCQKKDDSDSINFNNIIKIDSFHIYGVNPDPATCAPFDFRSWAGEGVIRFEYDPQGRILTMKKTVFGWSSPFCTYTFTYNNNNQPATVVSKSTDPTRMVHDSILFTYPSVGTIEATNFVTLNTGGVIYPIYTVTLTEVQNEITVTTRSKDFGSSAVTRFKAFLKRNSDGNIHSATYFHNDHDTSTVLTNEYYTSLNNPFYSVYQRLKFPWFYLIRFGGLSNGWHIIDLSQFFSKHCIKRSTHRYIPVSTCQVVPFETINQHYFPEDSTYDLAGNNVTRMSHTRSFMTLTGYINMTGFIMYK